jgi:outer membrane biogenesis lipoprotein LolB
MLRSIKHLWLLGLVASLLIVCALTACTTTIPNTTEKTAPSLTWKVLNRDTNTIQTYTGNASMTVTQGTDYVVTLVAEDTGGVRQITLGSSSKWTM